MAADDSELRVGVGADYSRGKYGSGSETTIFSVPLTARYETGRWTYKASVPWLEVKGPSNVVPGLGAVGNSGKPKRRNFAGTSSESGIGASQKMNERDSLGLSLDGRQKASVGGAAQRELTFFWNRRMDGGTRLQTYALIGLAKGSPDLGLGVSAAKSF